MDTLATGFAFLEAPRYDGEGGLYFTDDAAVYHLDRSGTVEVVDPDRPCGGLLLHRDGGIVVSGAEVLHLRADGSRRELLALPGVEWINDIYADPDGHVYCGSIPAVGDGTEADPPAPGHAWKIVAPGRATVLYDDVGFSNGFGLSPTGDVLYHCDTVRREIVVHQLTSSGVGARSRFSTADVPGGPDGLAVDVDGHLWVAMYGGGCIARFEPDGTLDRTIPLPALNVTSLAFGGPAGEHLYVVTCDNTDAPELGGCIYRIDAPVAGLPTPQASV